MKKYKNNCVICGEEFTANRTNAKYCPECKEIQKRRQSNEAKRMSEIRKQNKRSERQRKELEGLLRELDAYNEKNGTRLSYGQYVAMRYNSVK